MAKGPDDYLYLNYYALAQCILRDSASMEKAILALRRETMGDEKVKQVHKPVTEEEMAEILRLHKKGYSNSQVAKLLGHSDRARVCNAMSRYNKKQKAMA